MNKLKTKMLSFLFALLIQTPVFANDTYFFMAGGNLIPTTEEKNTIQMKSEIISIALEGNYYQVTVDFNFYNPGAEVELMVGFPFFEAGLQGYGKIYDFHCWTNNVLTDFSDMPLDRNFSNKNYDGDLLEKAYVREVAFQSKAITKTKVSYKSEYGDAGCDSIIKYLYGTGSSWKNSIEEITVVLENNLPYGYISNLKMAKDDISSKFKPIADNKWEAHFYNVEPSYTDCFTFYCTNILDDGGPKAFSLERYKFARSKANNDILLWYTKPQLRLLRNTIYALHGYEFKSDDLKKMFEEWGKNWYPKYQINPNFSEADFSEIEKFNINLLLEEEKRR